MHAEHRKDVDLPQLLQDFFSAAAGFDFSRNVEARLGGVGALDVLERVVAVGVAVLAAAVDVHVGLLVVGDVVRVLGLAASRPRPEPEPDVWCATAKESPAGGREQAAQRAVVVALVVPAQCSQHAAHRGRRRVADRT